MRSKLRAVEAERVSLACDGGLDAMSELLTQELGGGAWPAFLANVPDSWEEEEAISSLAAALRRPAESEFVLLLLPAS